jgi:hypothetical protein
LQCHAPLRRRFRDRRRRSIRANGGRGNLARRLCLGHERGESRDADLQHGPHRANVELALAGELDHDPGDASNGRHCHPPHGTVVHDLGAGHAGGVGIGYIDDDARRRCEAQRGEAQGPIADQLDDRGFRVARRADGEEPSHAGCRPGRRRERGERKHADLHL